MNSQKREKEQIMKKLLYVGGGSLLLLIALLCGAAFASPLMASAHGTATKPATTTPATTDKHPERRPLREFVRNHADEFVDRIAPQLHLSAAKLTAKLKSGQRLVDIAKDKGISREALRDILIKVTYASIEQAVDNGKLDRKQADVLRDLVYHHPFVVARVLHRHFYDKK